MASVDVVTPSVRPWRLQAGAAAAVLALSVASTVLLLDGVRKGRGLSVWDGPTLRWMVAHREPGATTVLTFISALGTKAPPDPPRQPLCLYPQGYTKGSDIAFTRRALVSAVIGIGAASLTGCGSSSLAAGTVVVDVRTPAEFVTGHLEGAVNIDIEASDFATKIATLDKKPPYFVYCRSGNRSSQAVAQMKKTGFTSVTDGGAMTAAAQTAGRSIVK
jgi:phage shock protein E